MSGRVKEYLGPFTWSTMSTWNSLFKRSRNLSDNAKLLSLRAFSLSCINSRTEIIFKSWSDNDIPSSSFSASFLASTTFQPTKETYLVTVSYYYRSKARGKIEGPEAGSVGRKERRKYRLYLLLCNRRVAAIR